MKQIKYEDLLKKMRANLSETEFKIIHLSFGVPLGDINESYQKSYTNTEIAEKLNLSSRRVAIFKNKAIRKLKTIYQKEQ